MLHVKYLGQCHNMREFQLVLLPGLIYCPYAVYINLLAVYVLHCVHIFTYTVCHLFLCTRVLIFCGIQISNQVFSSVHFTNCPCICETLTLYTSKFAYTNIWFIIDYHVNTDTQFLLFRCVRPSKYL